MLKRLITSITEPKEVRLFLNDKWHKVVLYTLFVPLLLLIPLLLTLIFNGSTMTQRRQNRFQEAFMLNSRLADLKIVDCKLEGNSFTTFYVDNFLISINEKGYFTESSIIFASDGLRLRIANVTLAKRSYVDLDLENFDFNNTSRFETNRLAFAVIQFLEEETSLALLDMGQLYVLSLRDFVFNVLIFALVFMLFNSHLMLGFYKHILISVYLSSVYILFYLISYLFSLSFLSLIGFVVVLIYHNRFYRSLEV